MNAKNFESIKNKLNSNSTPDINFIQSEFDFKNPSEERFRFLLFKSVKNVDILIIMYSTAITTYYNNSITYISLFDLKTKNKIQEYKSQNVRNLEQ